jgi:ribosome-associated toxin RatA of RatAB toxin-antitoxin module
MSTVQQAIEVGAPLHTVYEQLATFESYPQFMTGVEQVIQTSSNETHWIMEVDGRRREFDARITECSLDERVSWSAVDGLLLAETITLRPIGETRTQVVAQLEADVAQLMPSERQGQESLSRRLKADLASFKRLIEQDGIAGDIRFSDTGAILDSGLSDTGASTKSMRSSTAFGSPTASGDLDAASPAAVAARLRNRASGGAGMGSHAMPADDAWGDAILNEEERGSAHDI